MIKPSSPTPYHLRTYNLSEIDQRIAHVYMPLILYYPNHEICSLTPDDKVRVIKMSLSQSLTRYYPFAGRLHTPTASYIDCNDEGVVFVEAKNDSQLNMFQQISDGQLFADGMVWENTHERASLAAVQVNHFACGGMAVTVSMSHRIGDACTLDSFVSHWASVARYGSTDHKEVLPLDPHFIQSPATTNFLAYETSVLKPWRCANPVTRKFVFPNSKLQDLKNKVIALAEGESTLSIINKLPTRVEVLTALVYKTVVAATNPGSSSFKPSILVVPVNIRNKLVPKLPQTTVGNLIADMLVTTRHESESSLCLVVSEIKKQKMELERVQNPQLARQKTDLILSRLGNEDLENMAKRSFWCSSLCMSGLNKVDFGWGYPKLVSTTYGSSTHTGSVLMDTPNGDGIEAWVTLETQDMERFQNDKDMLSFAKIN
ncbi:akuammiline synthase 1-like [Bidens hawaiensis]|uniref:akuammiline synthase 1-like n=1 Tax=Bidens hawaiensis TaxID=980011 RepID=UPI004049F9EA